MHYRYGRIIITSIAAVALSGCTSTLRHTNLLVFGTNTTGGLEVGTNTNQIPRILFGYTRQELVLMPLLANTRAADNAGGNRLIPCGLEPVTAGQDRPQVVPEGCKFVGRAGGADGNTDTYSVLASFGASVHADGKSGGATAGGKVAQYFATGLAARALAENGGAAVIATGDPRAADGIYGSPDRVAAIAAAQAGAAARNAQKASFKDSIAAKISTSDDYKTRLVNIDNAVGRQPNDGFVKTCSKAQTAAECAGEIRVGTLLADMNVDDWTKALAAAIN